MVDLLDVSIEYAIKQGRRKEAADLLRKRGGESGQLFKMVGDLIDPDKLQRMGRPLEKDTPEYRSKQRAMMFDYYFLQAYYKAENRWKNPKTFARGAVMVAYEIEEETFYKAHKLYGKRAEKDVDICLEIMTEKGYDFPEWVKNYDK
jgi:hypothetical protein